MPLPSAEDAQNVLALLRMPGQEVVAFGGSTSELTSSLQISGEESRFIYAPFREDSSPTFVLSNPLRVEDAYSALPDFQKSLAKDAAESTSRDQYNHAAEKLMDHLRTELLKKVVLSRVMNFTLPSVFDAKACFQQLCETYPNAAVHLFAIAGKEMWIGASPECLIDFNNGQLQTISLAGTQPIGSQEISELKWSSKEKEEQQLVTDYIADILSLHDEISDIEQRGPETSAAGNVAHLKTAFSARTDPGFDWLRLVRQLHPTPAICGWPRDEALKIIEQNEAHRRLFYGGYFGTADKNNAHLYLNLRCMRITENKVQLFVGGGFTASSDIDAEWDETEHKAQTLLSVIENLRKFESS